MKGIVLIAAGAVALVSGCASVPQDKTSSAYGEYDLRKVAAINNAAKASGVSVYWINYPQKKSSTANAPTNADPSGT